MGQVLKISYVISVHAISYFHNLNEYIIIIMNELKIWKTGSDEEYWKYVQGDLGPILI